MISLSYMIKFNVLFNETPFINLTILW